jgi:hypothetical protein
MCPEPWCWPESRPLNNQLGAAGTGFVPRTRRGDRHPREEFRAEASLA